MNSFSECFWVAQSNLQYSGSNENGKFAIDKFSGVISVNDVASLTKKEHWLCALAT